MEQVVGWCAESDQSMGAEWGCYGTSMGAFGTAIGTGATNTTAIVAGCSETSIAAWICSELILNGYSDWFLPSLDELNLMYEAGIGGFASEAYWTSSENSDNKAWGQHFANGGQYNEDKNNYPRVRAIRAFNY